MNNPQIIYDALHQRQEELIKLCSSSPQRNLPEFQIAALADQIAHLSGAVALILKNLGAKIHE